MSTSEGQHRWDALERNHERRDSRWHGHVLRTDGGYINWEKDAEDGVARKEETGKSKKEAYGCGEK